MTGDLPGLDMPPRPPTIDEQIACVRRELAMRQKAYPKWVASQRMKQAEADRELARMQAVHDTLMLIKEGKLIPVLGGTIPQPPEQPR